MRLADADREAFLASSAAQAEESALRRSEVAALTARLGQTSANTSRPPSSAPPGVSVPRAQPSGRRPGGQPGDPGRFRTLLDVASVDHLVVCVPERCAGCGAALHRTTDPRVVDEAFDPADERRPGWERLAVAATVTAYRLAARHRAGRGHTTRAPLPVGVGADGRGPQLTAVSATCGGRSRLSKRDTAACLGDLCRVTLAVGTVSALSQRWGTGGRDRARPANGGARLRQRSCGTGIASGRVHGTEREGKRRWRRRTRR